MNKDRSPLFMKSHKVPDMEHHFSAANNVHVLNTMVKDYGKRKYQ